MRAGFPRSARLRLRSGPGHITARARVAGHVSLKVAVALAALVLAQVAIAAGLLADRDRVEPERAAADVARSQAEATGVGEDLAARFLLTTDGRLASIGRSSLGRRSVLVVGDSLLDAAVLDLRAALWAAGASEVTIVAQNGSTIGWVADRVVEHSGHDIVVIAAGTNNVIDGWTQRDRRETERAVRMISEARCPLWIVPTPWRHPVTEVGRTSSLDPTSLVGILIMREEVRSAGIQVADWNIVAAQGPELHDDDGVHHHGSGSAAYARFIADAVVARCSVAPWAAVALSERP